MLYPIVNQYKNLKCSILSKLFLLPKMFAPEASGAKRINDRYHKNNLNKGCITYIYNLWK